MGKGMKSGKGIDGKLYAQSKGKAVLRCGKDRQSRDTDEDALRSNELSTEHYDRLKIDVKESEPLEARKL